MKDTFNYILNNYLPSKIERYGSNNLHLYLMHEARDAVINLSGIDVSKYKVEGSAGAGNWAEVPWIAVFDKDITTSATKGYYIVYLFRADMTGVYLSLNQGWTFYKDTYGVRNGKIKIKSISEGWQRILASSLSDFNFDDIDLRCQNTLGKGYELGHICGKFYPSNNIPNNNVLVNDLHNMIGVYRELKGHMPDYRDTQKTINEIETIKAVEEEVSDRKFQNKVNKVTPSFTPQEPHPKLDPVIRGNRKSWPRKPAISRGALDRAEYKCDNDPNHFTFTSKVTNQNFVEAHHLIPMKLQEQFENSLDVTDNILSLCPTCHGIFHYATYEEKAEVLIRFYNSRKDILKKYNLIISVDDLKKAYK
jgi:5-methylcytosine-specific restriction protein A